MEVIMLTANMSGKRPQDWLNLILGALLFISPWMMGFLADTMPTRNAWLVGAVLAVIAIAALFAFAEWEEWVNLALGLWLIAAPWVLGFTGNVSAFQTHLVLGLLTAAVSAWAVWDYRHEPHATA
jgi:MFS family permease